MIDTIKRSNLITAVLFTFTFLLSTLVQAQVPILGFPDDISDSGRMINVTRGNSTLGDTVDEVLNVSIRVPTSETNVTIEIFDGNTTSDFASTVQGFWDSWSPLSATPDEVTFELYLDPNAIGNTNPADLIASAPGGPMADNDWELFVDMPNDPGAHQNNDPTQDFIYHLVARWDTENVPDISNPFKVRANGLPFLLAGSTIGYQGYKSRTGLGDTVFPIPLFYDGTFNFAAELIDGVNNCYIDIYDGDMDRSDDTDDPNTPNDGISAGGFYPFQVSPIAVDEMANGGDPKDDFEHPDPSIQNFIRISPSVSYQISGPTGLASPASYSAINDNPSGDKEYELFRIASSAPGCPDPGTPASPNPNYDPPAIDLNGSAVDGAEYDPPMAAPDAVVAGLGAGFHIVSVVGLDPANNAFINVSADIVPVDSLADYGDAPDSYATDATNDSGEGVGPSHLIAGELLIGATVDQELDGLPTVAADGDDNFGFDDEDGVTFTMPLTTDLAGQLYSVDVDVINGIEDGSSNPIDANLYGWIDFNGNGTFEASEGATNIVSSTGLSQTVALQFLVPADVQAGNSYSRFRLTTDLSISLATPGGAAENGEVEDYPITVETDECIPCKGMKTISFKMSDWSYHRHTDEIVRVRVGDLLGQFNGSDFSAPILFEGTVPNGGTIDIVVPDEHLGKTLTISVEGNSHHIEFGKARFHPDCDLQLWTKSGNSYIEFKVSAFEKNSEEICECVECEVGPAEVTFKITNTHGRDQNETIRVRVGDLSGSLGANPDDVANPVLFTGVIPNGGTFVVTIPQEHRGKTLSMTVQGNNHYYEFVKSKFHADCDLKIGDTSSLNGYLNLKVDSLKGDTGEICSPPVGDEGCTPGYWKQSHHFDSWINYEPGDIFKTVFGKGPRQSLLYRLSKGGGGYTAYHRHVVAALLNADNPDVNYFLDVDGVINSYHQTREAVRAVPRSQRRAIWNAAKEVLEHQNELGCPLN